MNALFAVACAGHLWCSYVRPLPAPKAAEACPTSSPAVVGGTQGYSDSVGSGLCYTSIEPMDISGMVYRSYAFFGDGLLMVFSSYGEGSSSQMTSAREFFFFPRRGAPRLTMDANAGTVSVRMGDGSRADFAPANAQISGLERGTVTVSSTIDPAGRGGVEIPRYAGLMLDAGFRMGESPSGRPDATSIFRDANGKACRVKNSDLFAYANGDHSLKLTDAQLSAWLKTACPELNSGF